MSTTPPTLLIADDDEAFRTRLGRAMEERGFVVTLAATVDAALQATTEAPEYAVVDLRMPGGRSGLDLVTALRERDANTRVVMLTGYGSIPTAVEATRRGAAEYLTKPADADQVLRALLGQDPGPGAGELPSLARAEWEYIHRVLSDSGDNISEAARRLGIHRRSLQRKLHQPPPTPPRGRS